MNLDLKVGAKPCVVFIQVDPAKQARKIEVIPFTQKNRDHTFHSQRLVRGCRRNSWLLLLTLGPREWHPEIFPHQTGYGCLPVPIDDTTLTDMSSVSIVNLQHNKTHRLFVKLASFVVGEFARRIRRELALDTLNAFRTLFLVYV